MSAGHEGCFAFGCLNGGLFFGLRGTFIITTPWLIFCSRRNICFYRVDDDRRVEMAADQPAIGVFTESFLAPDIFMNLGHYPRMPISVRPKGVHAVAAVGAGQAAMRGNPTVVIVFSDCARVPRPITAGELHRRARRAFGKNTATGPCQISTPIAPCAGLAE